MKGSSTLCRVLSRSGLIPSSWCFGRAVNVTLGLPIIEPRWTHTAFDIAGRGIADPTRRLLTAVQKLAARLAKFRAKPS
jgi:4-hydroxy-L-threonine phosphate dehydrogenase PdxA